MAQHPLHGISADAVVRAATDRGLDASDARRQAAGVRILEAEPMDVPEPQELLDELRAARR
jgi:hypothetical protein